MWIVDRDTLAKQPNGTVFRTWNGQLGKELHIISGRYKDRTGFNGELTLTPIVDQDSDYSRIINWATVDTCDYDYPADQKFAVFSKLEVQAMINILQWALSGCDLALGQFEDLYYCGDAIIPEKDLGDWIDDLSVFRLK